MNDEMITRLLQEALGDNDLQVEARRDGSQLLVIVNSDSNDDLDYETLTDWFVAAVRSLPGIQIETLKLQNAVAGKVKWYTQVALGSTNHSAPDWQLSDYCFIRNDLLLRTTLPKPTDDVCQIILTFDSMKRDQQYAILEALTAFFQSPAQIRLDPFPSESQTWFKSIRQLKEKPFKDVSIWMSRYCANPELTRQQLALSVPDPENFPLGSIHSDSFHSSQFFQPVSQPARKGSLGSLPQDILDPYQLLHVEQRVEWREIIRSPFQFQQEFENHYDILDDQGNRVFDVQESSSGLVRYFLGAMRPLTLDISNRQGLFLELYKPLRLPFTNQMHVKDSRSQFIGLVQQQFSLLHRKFVLLGIDGREYYQILGPLWRPWTFHILKNGTELGKIQKKWSGFGKELFTDADHFTIFFPKQADPLSKRLLLGAVFLVDLLYFETTK
jgi:hypothetical protein